MERLIKSDYGEIKINVLKSSPMEALLYMADELDKLSSRVEQLELEKENQNGEHRKHN